MCHVSTWTRWAYGSVGSVLGISSLGAVGAGNLLGCSAIPGTKYILCGMIGAPKQNTYQSMPLNSLGFERKTLKSCSQAGQGLLVIRPCLGN